jgi:hypothetical protein
VVIHFPRADVPDEGPRRARPRESVVGWREDEIDVCLLCPERDDQVAVADEKTGAPSRSSCETARDVFHHPDA